MTDISLFWDWIDRDIPFNKPLKLMPNSPKNIINIFNEWKKTNNEYDRLWENAVKNYNGKELIFEQTIKEFIKNYEQGLFNNPDKKTMIKAGWDYWYLRR